MKKQMIRVVALATMMLLVGVGQVLAISYTYDAQNRLTKVIYDNGNSIAYGYDQSGNITGVVTKESTNGECGVANGATFGSAPTSDLCAAGTPSAVVGSGPWSWTCTGLGGGSDASCAANSQTVTTTTTSPATTTTTIISGAMDYTLAVADGWSLISAPISFQVASHLADSAKYTSVWKWANNTWAVYLAGEVSPGTYAASKGFSQLVTINPGEGFWVKATGTSSVTISGVPVYGELTVNNGWNLLGLKSTQATTVANFIAGKTGIVSLWKWENGTWAVNLPGEGDQGAAYAASKGFSQLTTIAPGEGFWVNMP